MGQKIKNVDFRTLFTVTFQPWRLLKLNCDSDQLDTLSKYALFFEEIYKIFKNKVQECSTPLKVSNSDPAFTHKKFYVSEMTNWYEAKTASWYGGWPKMETENTNTYRLNLSMGYQSKKATAAVAKSNSNYFKWIC